MEKFLLPSKVEFHAGEGAHSCSVVITPCYHGYGTTLGNALRRVLLSSLPGASVEWFKIKGVQHEFSTIEGVKEDVVEVMLNLKLLAVKVFSEEVTVLKINKKGVGPVTAGDIEANSNVEIANKDLVICTVTDKAKPFEMEIAVGQGRGFKPVEEKDRKSYDLGTIVVDSVYTPVKDVGYHVEYTRVGDITNYEKLTINVQTNGTVDPQDAVRQATQILMDHFTILLDAASTGAPALREEAASHHEAVEETAATEESEEVEKKPKKKSTKKK